jgi:hypothetical protein
MTLPGVHRSGQRHHRRWVTCEGVTLRLQWSRSRHQSPSGRHRAAFGLILTSAYNAVLRSTCPTGLRRAAANPSSSPHDSQHCDNGMLLDRQEHSVRMVRAPQASGHTRRRPRKIAQPTSPWLGRLWSLSEPAHEFARTRSFWRRVWEVSTLDGAFKWLTSREQAKLLQSPDLRLVPSKRLAPPDSSCLSGQWPPCCALSSYMLTPRNQLPRQTVPSLHSLLRQHRLTSIAFFGDSVGDLYMQGIRYLLRRDAANCTSVSFAQAFPGFFGHPSTQGLRRVQSPVLECDGVRLFQVYQSTHMFLNRTTTGSVLSSTLLLRT